MTYLQTIQLQELDIIPSSSYLYICIFSISEMCVYSQTCL